MLGTIRAARNEARELGGRKDHEKKMVRLEKIKVAESDEKAGRFADVFRPSTDKSRWPATRWSLILLTRAFIVSLNEESPLGEILITVKTINMASSFGSCSL